MAQDAPESSFTHTVPVQRCGVEVSQPRVVGGEDSVLCGGVTDAREQTAERRAAETQSADEQVRVPDLCGLEWVHGENAAVICSSETLSVVCAIASSSSTGPWK